MYYYGARYYDPRLSIFISVDPLAEKYPSWTPYHYVHNNPINLIDPTGMEADGWGKKGNTWEYKEEITRDNYQSLGYDQYMDSGNIYSTTNGVADGNYNYSLNSDGSVQNSRGNFMNNSFSTIRGTTINVSKGSSLMGAIGIASVISDITLTGMENISGSFRISTTTKGFSPKYYANAWRGNQYATTYNIGKIAKGASNGLFFVNTGIDFFGVYKYYNNPNSGYVVHPANAIFNIGIGIYSIKVNPAIGLIYSGVDAFYPGGWLGDGKNAGAIRNQSRMIEENQKIIPNFNLYRDMRGGW